MSDICNNIISAIDILANHKIEEAGYDRTIIARIVSCINPVAPDGVVYKLKYQNSTLYATERNKDKTYNIGDLVYIKIPQNDFSQEKLIEGKVSKDKDSVASSADEITDVYEMIGYNSIYIPNEITMASSLQENIIYSANEDLGYITIDTDKLKNSTAQANSLMLQADFKTLGLDELDGYYRGNYGLKFTLIFKGIDETGEFNEEIKKDYLLDINSIEGNPYNSINYAKATLYINNIKEYIFDRVESITYFSSNFPADNSKEILINNIALYGANWITAEELKNATILVNLYAHEGIDLIENEGAIPLTLSGRVGKIKVEDLSSNLQIFWFKENAEVDSEEHSKYNEYGGIGWECLNSRAQGYNKEGEPDDTVLGDWETGTFTYNVTHQLFETSPITEVASIKVKAVAVYLNEENHFDESNILTLNNKTSATELPEFLITSISTTKNKVDLICQCNEEDLVGLGFDEIIYYWRRSIPFISKAVSAEKKTNKYTNIDLTQISTTETYSCTVVGKYEETESVIGEASIVLVGVKIIPEKKYSIKFGQRKPDVAVYKSNGSLFPINYTPYVQALLFTPENKLVDPALCSYSWSVSNPRLIDPIPEYFSKMWQIIKKSNSALAKSYFYYKLSSRFSKEYDKTVTITVTIAYQNIKMQDSFVINFEQEGEAGKVSSQTGVVVTPQSTEGQKYPTINTTKGTSTSFLANLFAGANSTWSSNSLLWSFLKNNNTLGVQSASTYSLRGSSAVDWTSEESPQFTATYPETEGVNNLIKVEATNEAGETYFDVVAPILVDAPNEDYDIELKYGTGFQEVEFSADGRDVKFLNRPFEAIVTPAENVTYEWKLHDSTGMFVIKNANEKICTLDINSSKRYDGINSDLAIECLASKDGAIVAKMYIPIYVHLSTYNNSAIQGWDGTGIVLDEDNNTVLTPQLGAGKKENDQFTGVILGQEYVGETSTTNIGLFGYHNNEKTIFLDAQTGSATFGADGKNQIILDPEVGKLTVHGDIYANNGSFTGHIDATSGTFQGRIEAEEGYFKGEVYADSGQFLNGDFKECNIQDLYVTGNLYYTQQTPTTTFNTNTLNNYDYYIGTGAEGSDYIHLPNFSVDSAGKVSLTGTNGVIEIGESGTKKIGTKISSKEVILKTYYTDTEVETSTTLTGQDIKVGTESGGLGLGQTTYGDYNIQYKTAESSGYFYISVYSYLASTSAPYIEFYSGRSSSACYGILGGTWKLDDDSIVTSDETKKNTINPLSDQYSILFDNLQPITYKYNDGASDRLHTGFGARATEQAILAAGLTTKDFAAVCYSLDEDGNKIDYGIRYGEIVALNTNEIQKLKARVIELENIIQELKNQ